VESGTKASRHAGPDARIPPHAAKCRHADTFPRCWDENENDDEDDFKILRTIARSESSRLEGNRPRLIVTRVSRDHPKRKTKDSKLKTFPHAGRAGAHPYLASRGQTPIHRYDAPWTCHAGRAGAHPGAHPYRRRTSPGRSGYWLLATGYWLLATGPLGAPLPCIAICQRCKAAWSSAGRIGLLK
jgi:hypothetical protein